MIQRLMFSEMDFAFCACDGYLLLASSAAKGTSMAMRIFLPLACLAVLPLSSCSEPAAPPPPSTTVALAVSEPKAAPSSCGVESPREVKLDDGTALWIWNRKANGLKRLTVRLPVRNPLRNNTLLVSNA